jgi:hypothetical protein
MSIDPRTKIRVPSEIPNYWTRQHEIYFIEQDASEKLRFRMEKMIARLLSIDTADEASVTYRADCSLVTSLRRDLALRLEDVLAEGYLYRITLDAKGEKNWYDEAEFFNEVVRCLNTGRGCFARRMPPAVPAMRTPSSEPAGAQ